MEAAVTSLDLLKYRTGLETDVPETESVRTRTQTFSSCCQSNGRGPRYMWQHYNLVKAFKTSQLSMEITPRKDKIEKQMVVNEQVY